MIHTHSAGGIILNSKNQVIVVNNRGYTWGLPKGHIEEGEEALKTAYREIYEETGVNDVKFIKPLGEYQRSRVGDESEMKTIHMFLFTTDVEELKPVDPENPEARWVDIDEVENLLTAPKDQEFFKSVKHLLKI